jgi:glycosyltransferase involved in cell wall biosynthesis
MSVLLFTDSDAFAGTERHIFDLAFGIRRCGMAVAIGAPSPSSLAERAAQEGIPLFPIAKGRMPDWRAAVALRGLLRTGQVDVIHSHNGRTALIAAAAVALAGRGACVTTQHFLAPTRAGRTGPKALVSGLVHGWVERHTAHTVMISRAVRDAAVARGDTSADKATVVLNGIAPPDQAKLKRVDEVRRELGVAVDEPLVVCAARLEREKDVATLVGAMAAVVRAVPRARCVVAGTGAQRDELQGKIGAAGLADRVRLLGFRNDVHDLMNAGDVFVLPAPAEPFGLVVVEAMALAKPVIATAAGGPMEIVEDGRTGLLVAPGDSGAMAAAITRLLSDPGAASAMGAAGRERFVQHFTADRMARDMIAVYRRVLATAGVSNRDGVMSNGAYGGVPVADEGANR